MFYREIGYIKSNDKEGEIMKTKKILTFILTLVMVISITSAAAQTDFIDVPENHPYKAAIDFSFEKGYITGINATTFMPDASLTRAQFAAIWCRALEIEDENHKFTDITRLKKYYDNPVIVLHSLGVVNGTSATKFSPDAFITRDQLAVLAMRTFNLGVANQDAYKQYEDHALIPAWAREGISACINAGVLEGLYDGKNFEPGKSVTRAEMCKLIYNLSVPFYNVTIGSLEGGNITASPTKARPGTTISLTVTPDTGKQLKEGTLKYNDVEISGRTFTMPAADVTITAVFEDKPAALQSIAVTTPPAKTTYTVGEVLDLSGLVVTATYSDNSSKAVTGYTAAPPDSSTLDTAGTVTVTISYTEGTVTKTTTFDVQVNTTS